MSDDELFRSLLNTPEASTVVSHAATVIVGRDSADGMSILMMRRSSKIAFGGMWVFPGGKVDADDYDPAAPKDLIGASARAGVREAKEEGDLDLVVTALVPYSHWSPPPEAPRRFLTWFFIVSAPSGPAGDVTIDETEITEHAWLTPRDALDHHRASEIELAPPTYVTLCDLADFSSIDDALDRARRREPVRFVTHMVMSEDGPIAMWRGDAGYEARDPTVPGPRHRVVMGPDGWSLLRS